MAQNRDIETAERKLAALGIVKRFAEIEDACGTFGVAAGVSETEADFWESIGQATQAIRKNVEARVGE